MPSSPAGMCEGVSSATPRPAAHESRASTGSRRPGLAPQPLILPCARESGRPAAATSRETRRPRSALDQTRGPGRRKAAAVAIGRRGPDGQRSGRRARKGLTRRSESARSGQPNRRCRWRPLKSARAGGRAGPGAGRCSRTPRPGPPRLSPHLPSRLRLRAPPHARAPRSALAG